MLTVVVFVHEMGHYLVGRWCGIGVSAFSIGFGPELIGFNDRRGTRWKLCAIPLGGYVKFVGDMNATSTPDAEELDKLTPAERRIAFHTQPVWKRALTVFAGPMFNFLLDDRRFRSVFRSLWPRRIGTDGGGGARRKPRRRGRLHAWRPLRQRRRQPGGNLRAMFSASFPGGPAIR